MTSMQSRLAYRIALWGVGLTLAIVAVDAFDGLESLDRWLYDVRARYCQVFSPPPTERLYHLDIDDQSLAQLGRWPWPRAVQAQLIDEIGRAGPRIIALDILLNEPQKPEVLADASGKTVVERIDHDQMMADACRRAGNVLIPMSVSLIGQDDRRKLRSEMVRLLRDNPEFQERRLTEQLQSSGWHALNLQTQVHEEFVRAAEQAMLDRLQSEIDAGISSVDALEQKLTPISYTKGERSDARILLDRMYPAAQSLISLRRFGLPLPSGSLNVLEGQTTEAPLPIFAKVTAFSGFVDFPLDDDGTVRVVPLCASFRGRLYPHMILATACAALGVDVKSLRFEQDRITIPLPNDPPIQIPVRSRPSVQYGRASMIMDIPWYGKDSAITMYDPPRFAEPVHHEPLSNVWKICQFQQDIDQNNRLADDAIAYMIANIKGDDRAGEQYARGAATQPAEARQAKIKELLSDDALIAEMEFVEKMPASEQQTLDEASKKHFNSYQILKRIPQMNIYLLKRQAEERAALRRKLQDKAVLLGWTATGSLDTYKTSLHAACPGIAVQGAVFNAILTRHLWRAAPPWVGALITLAMGSLATLLVVLVPPWRAALSTTLLVVGYLLFNGYVLFDFGDRLVPQAGPVTASIVVWGGLTLARFVDEKRERSRIERRFRSYVDPALVNYVVEHPESAGLDGRVKEMTVVFTDLAGFTTVSEMLRERTVPMLNEYMGLMLPIIRNNRGYWNKFLGDGIMFFFNAPNDNPNHARDAVMAVHEMQNAVVPFNRRLTQQGLPPVSMRAGISTGMMVVGDAGSLDENFRANDYTVLGDEVNLASRLEGANKALGSSMLMNGRAAELVSDRFLLRPLGCLRVVGKTSGVMTFESLCLKTEATARETTLAEMSSELILHFRAAKFDRCIAAAKQLEEQFGQSKFAKLYLEFCELYLKEGVPENFDGTIVLVGK